MLCIPSQCSPEELSCPNCHPAGPSNMTLTLPHLMGIPSWHQCPSKVAPTLGDEPHFTWWAALADTGNPPKCLLPQPCTLACSQKLRLGLTASHTGGQPHLPVHMQDSSCGPNTRERLTQPIQGTCASGLHIRRPLHKANSFQSGRYR